MVSPYMNCPLFTVEPWKMINCVFENDCYDKVCIPPKWSDLSKEEQESILSFFKVENAVPKISVLETEFVHSEEKNE